MPPHSPRVGSSLCSEPYDILLFLLASAQENSFLFRSLGSRCGRLEPPLENTVPQSVFLLILFKMPPWVFPTFLLHPGSASASSTELICEASTDPSHPSVSSSEDQDQHLACDQTNVILFFLSFYAYHSEVLLLFRALCFPLEHLQRQACRQVTQ